MSDDDLQKDVKTIAEQVISDLPKGSVSIKSCVITVPGHTQICLSNVKYQEECDLIAQRVTNTGKYGRATAFGNPDSGCNPNTHALVKVRRRRSK